MTTPPTPTGAQALSDLMRVIDAYAFDYKEQGKLGPTRREVARALSEALEGREQAGAVAHELLAFVKKIASGEIQDHMLTSLEDEASSLCFKATALLALARKA